MNALGFAATIIGVIALSLPHDIVGRRDFEPRPSPFSRVQVDADFDKPSLVKAVKSAVEASLPIFEKYLSAKLPPEDRIMIHLCASAESLATATTRKSPAGATAFTSEETKESWVVAVPTIDGNFLALVDALPEMTLAAVFREIAVQYARRAGLYPDSHLPDWYVSARADFLAARAIAEVKKRESTTYADLRLNHFLRIGTDREIPLADLLDRGLDAREGRRHDARATLFLLYDFLATQKSGPYSGSLAFFEKRLSERERPVAGDSAAESQPAESRPTQRTTTSTQSSGGDVSKFIDPAKFAQPTPTVPKADDPAKEEVKDAITADFRKIVGDIATLEKAFKAACKAPTSWAAIAASVDQMGDQIICANPNPLKPSLAVGPVAAKGKKYVVSGDVTLYFAQDRQAHIVFSYDPATGAASLISIGGDGSINLQRRQGDSIQGFASAKMDPTKMIGETPIAFEIAVNGRRIQAKIGEVNFAGELPQDATLPEKPMIGVGSMKSVVRFRKLKVRDG